MQLSQNLVLVEQMFRVQMFEWVIYSRYSKSITAELFLQSRVKCDKKKKRTTTQKKTNLLPEQV